MNFSSSLMSGMGISLGGLEIATDFLYANPEFYEPDLTEVKTNIYGKKASNTVLEKPVKPTKTRESVINKFNILQTKQKFDKDFIIEETSVLKNDEDFDFNFDDLEITDDTKSIQDLNDCEIQANLIMQALNNGTEDCALENNEEYSELSLEEQLNNFMDDIEEDDDSEEDDSEDNSESDLTEQLNRFMLDSEEDDDSEDNSESDLTEQLNRFMLDDDSELDDIEEDDNSFSDLDTQLNNFMLDSEEDGDNELYMEDQFNTLFGDEDEEVLLEAQLSSESKSEEHKQEKESKSEEHKQEKEISLEEQLDNFFGEDEDIDDSELSLEDQLDDLFDNDELDLDEDSLESMFDSDEEFEEVKPALKEVEHSQVKETKPVTQEGNVSQEKATKHIDKKVDISQAKELEQMRKQMADMEKKIQAMSRNKSTKKSDDDFSDIDTKKAQENDYEKYNNMSIETLYTLVKEYMIINGVGSKPLSLDSLNTKFGSLNIKKLVQKSYLIKIGKGVTIGR